MWYVLQVAVGREDTLLPSIEKALLTVGGCEVFTPHYQGFRKVQGIWRNETRVLFPGYVFVDTDQAEPVEKRLHIFTTSIKPVCIGGGFYPIRPEEQAYLMKMMDSPYEIAASVGDIIDGKLTIRQGPLRGRAELVRRIDRHKRTADVACTLWGEERRMRVGLELRRKIVTAEPELTAQI